ncbi:hypothetical protein PSA5_10425 [Pseudomonas syringae pv. actinidiae]|nr:hypothetical protein PSA5_10425 [Pseudomonas syringae pv. actinidiae]
MLWIPDDVGSVPFLNHSTRVHYVHPVAELRNQCDVMSNQQNGDASLPSFFSQQQQHLTLHGYVQCSGGLVCNQQFWFTGESQRDHYALTHAS